MAAEVMVISYQGKHVVWPPYVVVAQGEEVMFKAVGVDATVFLPMPEVFEETVDIHDGTARSSEPVQKTDKGLVLRVGKKHTAIRVKKPASPDYTTRTAYPYSVYCKEANTFAEGNSAPVMIIEPPPNGGQPMPPRTSGPAAKQVS
jgi:hypothetical protein